MENFSPCNPKLPLLQALKPEEIRAIAKLLSHLDMPGIIGAIVLCEGLPGICARIISILRAYSRLYSALRRLQG